MKVLVQNDFGLSVLLVFRMANIRYSGRAKLFMYICF